MTLSTVSSKVVDYELMEGRSADPDSSIDNVALPESQKGPFLQILSNMEEFVENSIHTLVQNVPGVSFFVARIPSPKTNNTKQVYIILNTYKMKFYEIRGTVGDRIRKTG